jgi:hypothetical protein
VNFGRIFKRKKPTIDQSAASSSISPSSLFESMLPQSRTTASGYMTEDEAAAYLPAMTPNKDHESQARRQRSRTTTPLARIWMNPAKD